MAGYDFLVFLLVNRRVLRYNIEKNGYFCVRCVRLLGTDPSSVAQLDKSRGRVPRPIMRYGL